MSLPKFVIVLFCAIGLIGCIALAAKAVRGAPDGTLSEADAERLKRTVVEMTLVNERQAAAAAPIYAEQNSIISRVCGVIKVPVEECLVDANTRTVKRREKPVVVGAAGVKK